MELSEPRGSSKWMDPTVVPPLPVQYRKPPFRNTSHVSTWLITINSNQASLGIGSPQYAQVSFILQRTLEEMFLKSANLSRFLRFNREKFPGMELTTEMLDNPALFPDLIGQPRSNRKLESVVEESPNSKRLHLHATFYILHFTLLWIDYPAMQATAKEIFRAVCERYPSVSNPNGIYLNIRFIPNHIYPVQCYMSKTIAAKSLGQIEPPAESHGRSTRN